MTDWPCPSLDSTSGKLALPRKDKLTPSLTLEKYGPTPHHRHASHLGSTLELTLALGTQVSRPWGHESRRADPAPLLCHVVVLAMKWCSPSLHPLLPVSGKRAGPGVTGVRKQTLTITGSITWESSLCSPSGQNNRADLVIGYTGESALRTWEHPSWRWSPVSAMQWRGQGKDTPQHVHLATCGRLGSWSRVTSERTSPASHHLLFFFKQEFCFSFFFVTPHKSCIRVFL